MLKAYNQYVLVVTWVDVFQATELQSLARGPERPMQIIWTSSSNAKKQTFQLDDIQHEHGLIEFLYVIYNMKVFVDEQSDGLLLHCAKQLR